MSGFDQFKSTYISECFELLEQMESDLLGLDESADKETLNAIFRCAHSIKGGAGAFGFTAIGQFTHTLEALLDKLREGELSVSLDLTNLLLRARDVTVQMVVSARDNQPLADGFGREIEEELKRHAAGFGQVADANMLHGHPVIERIEESGGKYHIRFLPSRGLLASGNEPLLLLRELRKLGSAELSCDISRLPAFELVEQDICYLGWDIVLDTEKSEADIREVFEFVEDECELVISPLYEEEVGKQKEKLPDIKNATPVIEKKPLSATPKLVENAPAGGASSIRVDIEKVDRLINMVGEIVITQAMLTMQSRFLPVQQYPELIRGVDELTQHTRELQEAVMAIRMQPVKSIFSRMPRIVRDLSQQLGKDIRLEMQGEATEVDKTIIEQLSDPLTHMIRNSVDHGVEMPEVRAQNGKPSQGVILLSAEHRGGKIVITISDDGAGINRTRVLAKAKEKGVVTQDAHLTDEETDMLIFAPGFSTAETVTNVSGRGVGMDVVKRNIEGLGGSVMVQNHPGKGSQFMISLPLTLAILDGMVVRVAGEQYIVPIANIIETMCPRVDEIKHIADGSTVLNVRGQFVPILSIQRLFGISDSGEDNKSLVVLVENNGVALGLMVDELVGQQQVVIKSLEENSNPIEGVSGATILGDGKVSLILDIPGLCRMNQKITHQERKAA